MTASKQVTKNDDQVPAHIRQGEGRGSENVGSKDIQLPRIDLIQALSDQIKKKHDSYIEGAEQGMLFNTLTMELYDEGVSVVPVFFEKQYNAWIDRDSGGGMLGSFDTMVEAENAVAASDKPAEAVETPTHIVYILDADGNPVSEATIPMSRSKNKVSRSWNSLIRLNGGDRFSRSYRITAVEDESAKGEYWNFKVTNEGWAGEEVYLAAEKLYESIVSGETTVKANYDDEKGGNPVGTGEPPAEDGAY